MFQLDSLQPETGIKKLQVNQHTTGLLSCPSQLYPMFRNHENKAPDTFIHRKFEGKKGIEADMRKFSAAVKTSKVPACELYRCSKGAGNLEQPTGSSTTTEQPELPWPKQQDPCCLRGQTAWQTEEMSPSLPVRGRKSKIEETWVAV